MKNQKKEEKNKRKKKPTLGPKGRTPSCGRLTCILSSLLDKRGSYSRFSLHQAAHAVCRSSFIKIRHDPDCKVQPRLRTKRVLARSAGTICGTICSPSSWSRAHSTLGSESFVGSGPDSVATCCDSEVRWSSEFECLCARKFFSCSRFSSLCRFPPQPRTMTMTRDLLKALLSLWIRLGDGRGACHSVWLNWRWS